MKTVFAYLLVALAITMSGCASTSGNAGLQNGTADKIVEGKTTLSEVRHLLGEPAYAQTTDKGEKIWSYYWSEAKVYPVAGFNKTDNKTMNIRFNKSGVVMSKDTGQSGSRF